MSQLEQRIKEFNKTRLPDVLPIKYSAMAENMFRFYRGTCHLFYEDLHRSDALPPSPLAWISGDLHLENFGSYKGDNRLVYFDLNDFDEAVLAPALWEVARIVTSILIAFETLQIEPKRAFNMAQVFIRNYAATLTRGKAYYIERNTAKGIVCSFLSAVEQRKPKRLLRKKTAYVNNDIALKIDNRKHFRLEHALKRDLIHHIDDWIINSSGGPYNYRVLDAAFRLAGTGSVGLKRYVFLLQSILDRKDYLLVDMKQATESSLTPYLDVKQPRWESHAHRIVAVQQRMQNIQPALLSTTVFRDEPFLLQELQPAKDSIDFNLIQDRYRDIYQVIDDMALLTASSQLRSSGRQRAAVADALIDLGQDTSWQEPVLRYAEKYAGRMADYYKTYLQDYKKGRYPMPDANEEN